VQDHSSIIGFLLLPPAIQLTADFSGVGEFILYKDSERSFRLRGGLCLIARSVQRLGQSPTSGRLWVRNYLRVCQFAN
jgi:hypothetical protein